MSDDAAAVATVHKSIAVPLAPQRAFDVFTKEVGTWWPLPTHSVGLERASGVSWGTAVGDELVETLSDGTTAVWGSVLESDPPRLIVLSWHPGQLADDATRLELAFSASADGGTIVELTHSGWERWADGRARASDYDEGWDIVLAPYVRSAATRSGSSAIAGP
jgi:uncharacterized protein YndB with AHSA1/START domain